MILDVLFKQKINIFITIVDPMVAIGMMARDQVEDRNVWGGCV